MRERNVVHTGLSALPLLKGKDLRQYEQGARQREREDYTPRNDGRISLSPFSSSASASSACSTSEYIMCE